jgi:DNA invertase Pin-like site-specific DNA recombinase
MPKAYSYIRFSSTKQQKGDSLKRQTDLRDQYLQLHPELELDTSISLEDLGVSAYDKTNITKGALGGFLRQVEEGRIPKGSYLLVESLDRLSRIQPIDALPIFLGVINAGITIVTLFDNQVHSRESISANPYALMMSISNMIRANEESATKSKRIRASWDSKRENIANKRLTDVCPLWMKPAEGDKGFELIPERVEVVKRIFQMSQDGIGNATIVKTLNDEGVPTFSGRTIGWQKSYIQKTLTNTAVYGEFRTNLKRDGETTPVDVIPDYYPAIMPREQWELAASARSSRRMRGGVSKGKNLTNLFSGLVRCGYCGGPMGIGSYYNTRKDGTKKEVKHLSCTDARRGLGCKCIQWNYTDFENLVLRFCKEVDLAQVLRVDLNAEDEINTVLQRLEGIKLEIAAVNARNEALVNALEAVEQAEPPKLIFDRLRANETKLANLLDERRLAEEEVAKLNNSRVDAAVQSNLIVDLLEQLETLEGNELHLLRIRLSEAIKRVVTKIVTFPGGRWYTEEEIETYQRDLIASDEFDEDTIQAMCAKLDAKPNRENRLLMLEFQNGEHRTVLSSGRILDQKTPPPSEWDVATLFESLAFRVFKRVEA